MGEPAGFDELFDQEVEQLLRLVTAITGSSDAARDVVQETFARAVARWGRVSRYDRPGAWLRRVAIRLAVRERAHRDRRGSVTAVEVQSFPASRDFDLEIALARLNLRDRTVLVLHYLLDLPIADIADAMQLRPNAVKARLHRARQRLRDLLEEDNVRS